MRLRTILDTPGGFRFFFENLSLQSSAARQMLLETVMPHTLKEISNNYKELEEFFKLFASEEKFTYTVLNIRTRLTSLRDIHGTLSRLSGGVVLDDIELFEIKGLALLYEDIKKLFEGTFVKTIEFDSLADIVSLLDPENQKITSFHIYDKYSEELSLIRQEIRKSTSYNIDLQQKSIQIEEKIRRGLCKELETSVHLLSNALSTLCKIDILIAKSLQIKELGLCIPEHGKEITSYTGLFNPEIKEIIAREGRVFQNVDISFEASIPVLITGANMGGKTVVLKTLALSQYLYQFGFGIPSNGAVIVPVSDIHFCIGDEQSIFKGLSSFAAEMARIDNLIKSARSGKNILALIDEPARTTNPTEGTALVESLIGILSLKNVRTILTTHYNIKLDSCKRLRVKGYENGAMNYMLTEDSNTTAPHEALQIARALDIDNEWIDEAEKIIMKNTSNKIEQNAK
ncbi:MAG: DNA mismatch repair protein MutS [Bacteroidales bacterium]|jgi:dsDNA-specific endonuclease/ATPase MutS2